MHLVKVFLQYKKLLSKKQWRFLPVLVIMMFIGGLIETISVSLILPFMDIVMNPEAVLDNRWGKEMSVFFSITSSDELMVVIAVMLAFFFIFKNLYALYQLKVQTRFLNRASFELQSKMLRLTLNHPYEYFMKIKSSEILNLVNGYVSSTFGLFRSMLSILSEGITVVMLAVALFVITPMVSILMGTILLILLLVISKVIKPTLQRSALSSARASEGMYKWVLQSLQGVKEVKIMKTERYFIENYDRNGKEYVDAGCVTAMWQRVPRSIIEAVIMSSFFITIAVYIMMGNNMDTMIPIMAAIALAAVRLLPAANRISETIAVTASSEYFLDRLIEFFEDEEQNAVFFDEQTDDNTASRQSVFEKEIRLDDVTFSYLNGTDIILKDACLRINKGESVGIVGASGAGKSTAMDILLGLLKPQKGKVTVDGADITGESAWWLGQVGYIPQSIFMLDDSIRLNVAFGVPQNEIDDNAVWRALDEAALGDFVRKLPNGLGTQIGERGMRLSGGQRQRIGIARALYRDPQVLFFDEATSALDNDTEEAIMEALNGLKGHKTMIIIAHRLTTIEGCDHVYRVEAGKIIQER